MVLSGGQVVLAYIIIAVCFAVAMAVLCGEFLVKKAHRKDAEIEISAILCLTLQS